VPSGLAFDPSTAVLSGVPAAAGLFLVTISAIDANDCTASRAYNLAVSSALPVVATALALDAAAPLAKLTRED
jgi:hypothetical protein